jgi:transposase InsO family protein
VLKAKTLTPTGKRLDILTLHRRFGHLNFPDLRKLWASGMVDGLDLGAWDDDISCEACLAGKTARKPFPEGGRRRASRVLELVHSDICGPFPNSIGGSSYFITFVDDHSAHVDVDFLKKKSEALASFRAWKIRVEKETGQRIGKIRTDNAGELTSNEFEAYLAGDGIVHQTTAPHSSQQNGVAERINRTLEESARANLTEAGLSIGFWADAVAYGAATRNFCPTRSSLDGRIPEEVW